MFVAEPKVSVLEIKNVHSLRKQQDRVSRKFQDRAIVSMDIDAGTMVWNGEWVHANYL